MVEGNRFVHYKLRTKDKDIDAARQFYKEVVGDMFWGSNVSIEPLPEIAVARGAPAHWLGQLGADDVERISARIVAAGGQQLGPVLRDPFGAVMALRSGTADGLAPAAWHVHHSQDHLKAFAFYSDLFGWTGKETLELGPQLGRHQMFAWDASGETVGSMANTATLSHIHPQWLFFFRVPDIAAALEAAKARGGNILEPTRTSRGDVVAACEDPQGAAFGLYQGR